jgi:hypothetical protein
MNPHWLVRMEDPRRWKPLLVLGFDLTNARFRITAVRVHDNQHSDPAQWSRCASTPPWTLKDGQAGGKSSDDNV